MSELYGKSIQVLIRSLDFNAKRHSLIVSNLANADVPGYKAVHFPFEKVLKDMISRKEMQPLERTHPNHLPAGGGTDFPEPEVVVTQSPAGRDGNTVDEDQETVRLAMNQVQFDADVEALSRVFALLQYSIEEGGR